MSVTNILPTPHAYFGRRRTNARVIFLLPRGSPRVRTGDLNICLPRGLMLPRPGMQHVARGAQLLTGDVRDLAISHAHSRLAASKSVASSLPELRDRIACRLRRSRDRLSVSLVDAMISSSPARRVDAANARLAARRFHQSAATGHGRVSPSLFYRRYAVTDAA